MSKPATKAANSPFYLARMEAAKVNDRFSSREGAADETGIDRTRLARIELDSITPYPEEVMLRPAAFEFLLFDVLPDWPPEREALRLAGVRPRYDAGACRIAGRRQS